MRTSALLVSLISTLILSAESYNVPDKMCALLWWTPACITYDVLIKKHGHGLNCASSFHNKCRHAHPDPHERISNKLQDFISAVPDQMFIEPHQLIACYKSICAWVTAPKDSLGYDGGGGGGIRGEQAKGMAYIISHRGQGRGCSKCGQVQTGWPYVKDKGFVAGSLKFDWADEDRIRDSCGVKEGLCAGFWGA